MGSKNDLMEVKQLPIIAERLESIRAETEEKVKSALSLVCTDETLQTVKKVRAELNCDFEALEKQRKEVKQAIMKPYNEFEALYKDCVTEVFRRGIVELGEKITDVEDGLKDACRKRLETYFRELCAVNKVDFISFEQTGVKVDMASARQGTPKKLMEQIRLFVEGVSQSMETINSMSDGAEIAVEYKKTLNMTAAIFAVSERKRAIIEAQKELEEREAAAKEEAQRAAEAAAIAADSMDSGFIPGPPKSVQKAAEKKIKVRFTVTDTKERLILLKRFLTENGYQYE